jgi:hypothetical protein
MPEIPVSAEGPSAAVEPYIIARVDGAIVSWHPERGWMCEEHPVQPCTHTADLVPAPPEEF